MRTFEGQRREFIELALKLMEDTHWKFRCEYDYEHAALYNELDSQVLYIGDDYVDSCNETELQKLRDLVEKLG